jgi:NarL family two-component system sensor histidine kinase YdfH
MSIFGENPPQSLADFLIGALPALLLLAFHVLLHMRGLSNQTVYHGLQSALIAGIGFFSAGVSPVITLAAWMCGETVASESSRRVRIIATSWHAAAGLLIVVFVAGAESALQWVVAAVPTIAFVIIVILLYARESRARESAEELARELADSNRRIAEYAEAAAFQSREQERQRMARDLHDTLAQGLTGVILQIRAAGSHLDSGRSERASAILAESLDQAQHTLRDARRAIQDRREADALDAAGSASAANRDVGEFLTGVCDDLARRYELPVHFSDPTEQASDEAAGQSPDPTLPGSSLFELAAIVGEAVHNAARHGRPKTATVGLRPVNGALELTVTDDGAGFDPATVPDRGHYGIQGMRERARAIGGQLRVTSAPGRGTTIIVTVPTAPATNPAPAHGTEVHDG